MRSGPLQGRNFRLLVAADIVSVAGTAVAQTAVPFAVFTVGGTGRDVGYVTAASMLAFLVFLLIGGAVADRFARHKVIVVANMVQCAAQATAAALVLAGAAHVWELVLLAVIRGVGAGFHLPAAAGLLPQTVPAGELARANAVHRVGRNTAQIGGAALGGVLVGLIGAGWGLGVDAASFAVAAVLRTGMRFPAALPWNPTSVLQGLQAGWREFASRRWLWSMVLQFSAVEAVSVGVLTVIGPTVARSSLGGARGWGLVLSAYAIGSVAGGAALVRFPPRRLLLDANLGVFAYSSLVFALAAPAHIGLVMAAALLAGCGGETFNVCWATAVQQEIPPGALSRINAYDSVGSFALSPVGAAAAGPLMYVFGASAVLMAGGGLVVCVTAAVLTLPEVRQTRRRDPGRADDLGTLSGKVAASDSTKPKSA